MTRSALFCSVLFCLERYVLLVELGRGIQEGRRKKKLRRPKMYSSMCDIFSLFPAAVLNSLQA